MISNFYLAVAALDFLVLIWAFGQWRTYRGNGVFYAMLPLTLLWFDNFTVGLGQYLGEGDLLFSMNYVRFVGHYVLAPMTFIALGAMARQAGFAWAQPKAVMALFCLIAAFFIVEDMWSFLNNTLHPSCAMDTLRYSTRVLPEFQCGPNGFSGGTTVPPIAPILMSFMMIAFGVLLWVARGYRWLALGSAGALPFFAIMPNFGGGVIANIGEPIISAAIVAAAAFIARSARQGEAPQS